MGVRKAQAEWKGDLKGGSGTMSIGGRFEQPFTFSSRFEEGAGSNPEELLAAAHAGCYSMALSHGLAEAGHAPDPRQHHRGRLPGDDRRRPHHHHHRAGVRGGGAGH